MPELQVSELPEQSVSQNDNVQTEQGNTQPDNTTRQVNIGNELQILINAVNVAQKRGAFSLKEAGVIGTAVETIENFTKPQSS
jgi:hypothetical protein